MFKKVSVLFLSQAFVRNAASSDIERCTKTWVQINDSNFNSALNWYKSCSDLSSTLNGPTRDDYNLALIENIKKSSDHFFKRSSLPLDVLAGLERDLGAIVDNLLYPPELIQARLKVPNNLNKGKSEGKTVLRTSANERNIMRQIYTVAIVSVILTFIIFIVMCLLCAQYKKMRDRRRVAERAEDVCYAARCDCGNRRKRVWETGEQRKGGKREDDSISCDEVTIPPKAKSMPRIE